MNHRPFGIWVICAGLLPASFAATKSGGNSGEIDYNRDIRRFFPNIVLPAMGRIPRRERAVFDWIDLMMRLLRAKIPSRRLSRENQTRVKWFIASSPRTKMT